MVATGTAPVKLEVLGFEKKGTTTISDLGTLKKGPSEQVSGTFAVQIASFRRIEGAIVTQEKYDSYQGYRTIIKDTEYNNERLFRVWLSGYKSEAEARDFIAQGPFEHAFIVRE
jgi:rare lipoprotein A